MTDENPYQPPETEPRETETRLARARRCISQNPYMTLFIVLVAAFLIAEILGVFTGIQQTFVLPS